MDIYKDYGKTPLWVSLNTFAIRENKFPVLILKFPKSSKTLMATRFEIKGIDSLNFKSKGEFKYEIGDTLFYNSFLNFKWFQHTFLVATRFYVFFNSFFSSINKSFYSLSSVFFSPNDCSWTIIKLVFLIRKYHFLKSLASPANFKRHG
jgi:hypothetical protein